MSQPSKGTHPPGVGTSGLEHLLAGNCTIAPDRGLFIDLTRRMNPAVCSFISEAFYDGRLHADASCDQQRIGAGGLVDGTGLRWLPVDHGGNRTSSVEEARALDLVYRSLLGREWINQHGERRTIGPEDLLVVAPYNAQVSLLASHLPEDALIGTVDMFQGKEGAVVLVSMAASTAEDVPRGMEFLYSRNRLNVAVSRARALVVLAASPSLLRVRCRSVEQMRLANGLCRYVEMATPVSIPGI